MPNKLKKLTIKRQRRMKWMNKRREMMTLGDSMEENQDNTQTSQDEGNLMVIRIRWQSGESNQKKTRKALKMKKMLKDEEEAL